MAESERGATPVQSVVRAFQLLEVFRSTGAADVSLKDLADLVGLPRPTTYRLAATLVSVGALERTAGGYTLGIGLFELGEKVARRRAMREAALPFLEDLYERWHETVHLAVLDGPEVLYIERISGHRAINTPSLVGERLPAHCTGVGKALLAFTPEALAAIKGRRLPGRTRYSIRVWSLLEEEMERIRAAGVAFDREEGVLGICCVAAPVLIAGDAVAAVSVTGPLSRFDPRLAEDSVRRAAGSIRSALSKRRPARSV